MVNGGQEDVQRQQQNGQERETICGLIGGLASNSLQHPTTPFPLASLSFSAWCDRCHDTSTQEWERKERDDGDRADAADAADGRMDGRSTQNTCS